MTIIAAMLFVRIKRLNLVWLELSGFALYCGILVYAWLRLSKNATLSHHTSKILLAAIILHGLVAYLNMLLCRSGQRSRAAATALTAAGFTSAYNIADGFEGSRDEAGHRGTSSGWKALDLPWLQD